MPENKKIPDGVHKIPNESSTDTPNEFYEKFELFLNKHSTLQSNFFKNLRKNNTKLIDAFSAGCAVPPNKSSTETPKGKSDVETLVKKQHDLQVKDKKKDMQRAQTKEMQDANKKKVEEDKKKADAKKQARANVFGAISKSPFLPLIDGLLGPFRLITEPLIGTSENLVNFAKSGLDKLDERRADRVRRGEQREYARQKKILRRARTWIRRGNYFVHGKETR